MKHVIAIDMGATNIRVGVIDEKLNIIEVIRERTCHDGNVALINQIIRLINEVHFSNYEISSITIGVPGRVRNDGYVYELPNIHVKDLDLVTPLTKEFGVSTYVINDATAAGLAEAVSGSGKQYSSVFFITISSGVGGSYFVDHNYKVASTEIGHTLFEYKGEYYEFEHICSGYGIKRLASINNINLEEGYHMFIGYKNGDEALTALYKDWLNLFHKFFGFIQNTFSPEVIVLTGGVMKSADIFLKDLKENNPNCNLVKAYHDQDAGLIGSACYGLQKEGLLD
jgi:glucokinase